MHFTRGLVGKAKSQLTQEPSDLTSDSVGGAQHLLPWALQVDLQVGRGLLN